MVEQRKTMLPRGTLARKTTMLEKKEVRDEV